MYMYHVNFATVVVYVYKIFCLLVRGVTMLIQGHMLTFAPALCMVMLCQPVVVQHTPGRCTSIVIIIEFVAPCASQCIIIVGGAHQGLPS